MIKKIVFLVIICLIPLRVYAGESNKLIYGIENFKITKENINIEGWAYVDRVHSLGGKNFVVNILAVRKSKLNGDIDNYRVDESDYVVANGKNYAGGNWIYPYVCRRDSSNKCKDVFYGYYTNNIKDRTGKTGEIENGKPYATCNSDTSNNMANYTSCIYYDTKFEASFSINDLKSKFGNDEFVFVIEIKYSKYKDGIATSGDGCVYTKSGYVNCDIKKNNTIKRYLTFDDSVLNGNSGKGLFKININKENNFKIRAEGAYILKSDGKRRDDNQKFDNGFSSSLSKEKNAHKKVTINNAGTGLNSKAILYKFSNGMYAWSLWGNVTGMVTMRLPVEVTSPPTTSCKIDSPSNSCQESSLNISDCQYLVIYKKTTNDFNLDGCGKEGYYEIQRIYNLSEKNDLKMSDVFNKNYNPGLGFENSFSFERKISWSGVGDYFYKIGYYYEDENGNCIDEPEEGYVNSKYLTDKNINVNVDLDLVLLNSLNLKKEFVIDYKYPNSNEIGKYVDNDDDYVNVYKDISDIENNIKYEYTFRMNNVFINRKNTNFTYSNKKNDSNYLDGGLKYYIPYYAKNGSTLNFITYVKNSSVVSQVVYNDSINLTSTCPITIIDGKLEKMKYRVVDLNNPFPNKKPTLTSNWYKLWSSNNNILIDRYNQYGLEYVLDLPQKNIKQIRNFNYLYISNENINIDGSSKFFSKYLKNGIGSNAKHYELGKGAVG